jgi:hypothetical protein
MPSFSASGRWSGTIRSGRRPDRPGLQLIEEELHDLQAGLDIQVEGAVDKLGRAPRW